MNPTDLPSQAQTTRKLRALPSLPPKRRCKATVPDENDPGSVIVPFYNPLPKPARFHRSTEPFQVWKEPKSHRPDPAPTKPAFGTAMSESVQGYARSVALLLSSRVHPSP
jgi:hypothetical protein